MSEEKCEFYENGKAIEVDYFRERLIACNQNCPYGLRINSPISWEDEKPLPICKTKGLIKKTEKI